MPGIIDGKALAETIRKELAASVEAFHGAHGTRPKLATILVGDDPASHVYVRNKVRACEQIGIESESHYLNAAAPETEILHLIGSLNTSNEVDGILLQLPLPPHVNRTRALDAISPTKDVDGLHPLNTGLLVQRRAALVACTPLGVIECLKRYQVPLAGRNAVVVGRGDLVGKPLALLLMHENATVTICHSHTANLSQMVSRADIVVAATGKAAFITPEFIREGAVVVDVGTTVLKTEDEVAAIFGSSSRKLQDLREGKTVLAGDVHPSAYEKCSLYTPVPGGVGPLTITMLLANTLRAAESRRILYR